MDTDECGWIEFTLAWTFSSCVQTSPQWLDLVSSNGQYLASFKLGLVVTVTKPIIGLFQERHLFAIFGNSCFSKSMDVYYHIVI